MRSSSRAAQARSIAVRLVVWPLAVAVAIVLLLGALDARPARAQDAASVTLDGSQTVKPASQVESDCDRGKWGKEREINGHRFLTPTFVESALVVSYIGTRSGFESEETPRLPLEELGDVDIHQARIAESIDLQVRVLQRVGLQLTLAGLATSATTSRSLVARGGDYRGAIDGGVLVELFRLRGIGTQLSLHGSIGTEQGHNITLLPLLDALDRAPISAAAALISGKLSKLLVPPYSNVRWSAGAAVAQPFNRAFSAQGSIAIQFEDIQYDTYDVELQAPRSLELSRVTPLFGLALTGDAIAIGVPVALMLEYRLSLPHLTNENNDRTQSRTEQIISGGVYYSGRADLQVGLSIYGQFGADPINGRDADGEPEPSGRPSLIGTRVMLRYFW